MNYQQYKNRHKNAAKKFNLKKKQKINKGKKPAKKYKNYVADSAEGFIEITRAGSAYFLPDDRQAYPEDIFIFPQKQLIP